MNDATDHAILTILQDDARTPNAEIARRLGMAPSAILERIRKLESKGLIRGYEARLDPTALNLGLLAFIFVRADEPLGEPSVGAALARIPAVQEVHHITGEDCYLVKVRAASTADLGRLLRERFGAIPGVRSTRTTIVLDSIKESSRLPLGAEATEDAPAGEEERYG